MVLSRDVVRRAVALFTATAALAALASARVESGRTGFEPFRTTGTTQVAVPAPFDLPESDTGLRLTTVVTTDFDSDGDLDVVASDGATHLFVWINDGAGHLTRKAPLSNGERQLSTSTPTVAERSSTTPVSIQPAGAVAISSDRRICISLAAQVFGPRGHPRTVSPAAGSLGSRAPPARPLFV